MAQYHNRIPGAGARVVDISVDPPERNTAMVAKLRLPYPLLADPDGERAIKPDGVWHDGQDFARPAVVLVTRAGARRCDRSARTSPIVLLKKT